MPNVSIHIIIINHVCSSCSYFYKMIVLGVNLKKKNKYQIKSSFVVSVDVSRLLASKKV